MKDSKNVIEKNMKAKEQDLRYAFDTESIREELEDKLSHTGLLKNVTIGICRVSDRELVKRPAEFEGIEEYCYICGSSGSENRWSVKLTPELLDRVQLSEEEIWKAAERNTYREAEITFQSMESLLKDIFVSELIGDQAAWCVPMFVISNPGKLHGAVQIFNKKAVKAWAGSRGYDRLIVLPSSIHEVIVVPSNETDLSKEELDRMVTEVNSSHVDPAEQLSDRAYLIELSSY